MTRPRSSASTGRVPARLDAQAEGHVLEHGHVAEQGVVLEDEADIAGADMAPTGVDLVHQDLAAGREVEAGDDPEQGRLARAGRPEERHELALAHLQGDPPRAVKLSKRFVRSLTSMLMSVPLRGLNGGARRRAPRRTATPGRSSGRGSPGPGAPGARRPRTRRRSCTRCTVSQRAVASCW